MGSLTREHSENGSKGVELEAVDDVSEMANFYGHEDAPGGQQEDVQALRHDAQPQHSCGEKTCLCWWRQRRRTDSGEWGGGVDSTERMRMDEWRGTKRMARRAWRRWTTQPAVDLHSVREDKVEGRRWSIQGGAQRCVMEHQILRFTCKPRWTAT